MSAHVGMGVMNLEGWIAPKTRACKGAQECKIVPFSIGPIIYDCVSFEVSITCIILSGLWLAHRPIPSYMGARYGTSSFLKICGQ